MWNKKLQLRLQSLGRVCSTQVHLAQFYFSEVKFNFEKLAEITYTKKMKYQIRGEYKNMFLNDSQLHGKCQKAMIWSSKDILIYFL